MELRMNTLETVMVNGFVRRLNLKEAIQGAMAAGNYEPLHTEWIVKTLSIGGRFVDVGANFGYFASLASRIVGPTGRVFAFEPSPIAGRSLQAMIDDNQITNMELCRAAVGQCPGEIEIHLPPADEVVHSPSAFVTDPCFTPCRVPMVSLDSYPGLNDGKPIDLIKIDVEGYEPNVIEGMRSLIRRGLVRNMTCEFNSGWLRHNSAMTPAKLLEIVLGLGFEITATTEKTTGMERGGLIPYELQDILFCYVG